MSAGPWERHPMGMWRALSRDDALYVVRIDGESHWALHRLLPLDPPEPPAPQDDEPRQIPCPSKHYDDVPVRCANCGGVGGDRRTVPAPDLPPGVTRLPDDVVQAQEVATILAGWLATHTDILDESEWLTRAMAEQVRTGTSHPSPGVTLPEVCTNPLRIARHLAEHGDGTVLVVAPAAGKKPEDFAFGMDQGCTYWLVRPPEPPAERRTDQVDASEHAIRLRTLAALEHDSLIRADLHAAADYLAALGDTDGEAPQ